MRKCKYTSEQDEKALYEMMRAANYRTSIVKIDLRLLQRRKTGSCLGDVKSRHVDQLRQI